jgi:hypothetical protein
MIPEPDDAARDYLMLALRLDKLRPGIVDSYYGPASLKTQVDAEPPRTPTRLREEAAALQSRLRKDVLEPDRQRWLLAQVIALEAQAMMLAGDPLAYLDYVACCLDFTPERTPDTVLVSAAEELGRLLPPGETGNETIAERLTAWDAPYSVDPDRLPSIAEWLLGVTRSRTDRLFGLPTGETVQIDWVSGKPWSAGTEYAGGFRTRIDANVDLLARPAALVHMIAHQCYPGLHTSQSWKERHLVDNLGRLEASVAVLNSPESLVAEGLATLGERIVVPDATYPDLLVELFERAGLAVAGDPAAARDAADRHVRIRRASAILRAATANAALMLHADGASRDEVAAYLRDFMLLTPDRAEKRLAMIEDHLYRAYVVVHYEGERLLRRWFDVDESQEPADRFGRLLRQQLTPGSISRDLAAAGFGTSGW